MFNASMLQPAYMFAQQFGVKGILYGQPGSAKTPILAAASTSCALLLTEPGALSLRNSGTMSYMAETYTQAADFLTWAVQSAEAKQFDLVAMDSVSELCEQHLAAAPKGEHGLQSYGKMARDVYEHLTNLYHLKERHVLMTAKMQVLENEGSPVGRRPYFPGKELVTRVPHLFDEILYIARAMVPGAGEQLAIHTKNGFSHTARDRSGLLGEFEQPDLAAIIAKIMNPPQG